MATRLFVCDDTGEELWELDPDGADSQGSSRTLPATLASPQGMTRSQRTLYWSWNLFGKLGGTTDTLWELGSRLMCGYRRDARYETSLSGITFPTGLTVFDGRFLIGDKCGDQLWEIAHDVADGEGNAAQKSSQQLGLAPPAMTVLSGRLFVCDQVRRVASRD